LTAALFQAESFCFYFRN